MKRIHWQHELLEYRGGELVIDAQERIKLVDTTATVVGGVVEAYGDSHITLTRSAVLHAHDDTVVVVPAKARGAVVYAHNHASVDAFDGHTYTADYVRAFLGGRARADADGRALVVADGASRVTVTGGAPTVRILSGKAQITAAPGVEIDNMRTQ